MVQSTRVCLNLRSLTNGSFLSSVLTHKIGNCLKTKQEKLSVVSSCFSYKTHGSCSYSWGPKHGGHKTVNQENLLVLIACWSLAWFSNLERSKTFSSFPLASTYKRTKFPNQGNSLVSPLTRRNPWKIWSGIFKPKTSKLKNPSQHKLVV